MRRPHTEASNIWKSTWLTFLSRKRVDRQPLEIYAATHKLKTRDEITARSVQLPVFRSPCCARLVRAFFCVPLANLRFLRHNPELQR
jgi:fructosamine-3-kinase